MMGVIMLTAEQSSVAAMRDLLPLWHPWNKISEIYRSIKQLKKEHEIIYLTHTHTMMHSVDLQRRSHHPCQRSSILAQESGCFSSSLRLQQQKISDVNDSLITMQTVNTSQLKPSARSLVHLRKEMMIGRVTQQKGQHDQTAQSYQ